MAGATKSIHLRFGEFVADLTSGELFKNGVKVPLQDKPYQILALLLSRPKQLVSRQEIIRTVWPDTFVEGDLSLNVAVRRLRAALADDAVNARFVETVGSHGYRFIANIHGSSPLKVAHPRDGPRLAVFPLKPTRGTESESLASSLTELLIIHLRRSNSPLFVITPEFTTERRPKGKSTISLCRDVSADYVLVGAVSRASGQVRVTIRLLNCLAQCCLWAESYTRREEDLFAVEEEISRSIAAGILQTIPNVHHLSPLQLTPPSATEKFLRGCVLLARLTELNGRTLYSTVRGGGPGVSAVSAGVGVARQRALLVRQTGDWAIAQSLSARQSRGGKGTQDRGFAGSTNRAGCVSSFL